MNAFERRRDPAESPDVVRARRDRRSDLTFMTIFGIGVCGAIAAFVAVMMDINGSTIDPKDFRLDEPTRISSPGKTVPQAGQQAK